MTSGSDDAEPEARRVRWREWFLLNGRRHLVFGVALVALFWTFALLFYGGFVSLVVVSIGLLLLTGSTGRRCRLGSSRSSCPA